MLIRLLLVLAAVGSCVSYADPIVWPEGKRAALVLTYDDALRSQLDVAVPQLEVARLKGTFFLDGDITPNDMLRWRAVAQNGHELGNHSLFHPCPREFFKDRERYATEHYDTQSMLAEIAAMNNVLFGIDGGEGRTYSYPCSQSVVGAVDYTTALARSGLIRYARTGGDQHTSIITDLDHLDEYKIPSWGFVDRPSGERLIAYVQRVQETEGLGVLQFHGVGGDYLEVSAEAHRDLVNYLVTHPDIWVGTFREVMGYLVNHRKANIADIEGTDHPTRATHQ
jgi:peptidoglycan-N-acetylglucosamine deacetylase